ncbi:MAG TPA: SgcJ/EcaC family oxidoreductase [Mycobacteriales bacterium]
MSIDLDDLTVLPAADRDAIAATLIDLQTGFTERDAERLRTVYSDDADWVNAFGSRKRGSADIVAYLHGLFRDDNFAAGTLTAEPDSRARVLTPEVVTVSTHLAITGQGMLDGSSLDRDNHSLRVLVRQPDGSWPIVSEMYMDAHQEQSYRYHS